jgi:hypothetical protein
VVEEDPWLRDALAAITFNCEAVRDASSADGKRRSWRGSVFFAQAQRHRPHFRRLYLSCASADTSFHRLRRTNSAQ